MQVKFIWPTLAEVSFQENVYFGMWHPHESIEVAWSHPSAVIDPVCLQAKNWCVLSTRSPLHADRPGLIHAHADADSQFTEAVAFRGYILGPQIHSYSSSEAILSYWFSQSWGNSEHNGVFSAACIRDSGRVLHLITDAFGMAPLYYRNLGGGIVFSTNPRYLSAHDDKPDYMAWRCLLQAGFLAADRSLTADIRRVAAGHSVEFQAADQRERARAWFRYEGLPEGTRRVDAKAVAIVEDCFQEAVTRCLRLQHGEIFLPLTSGYDSRRILAGLMDRKRTFESVTVRVFQKQFRDLDARFAAIMAEELGFLHRVIEPQSLQEYAFYDYQRRILLDAESPEHSWAVALMKSLPPYPTIVIDGLAGDALGETGFDRIHGLHIKPDSDKMIIASHVITHAFDRILNLDVWPSAKTVRHDLIDYIDGLCSGLNQSELAFLLLRTRRSIAVWAQQMLPAGHLVVCPYLDLDYVKTLLRYHPGDKLQHSFQSLCLKEFWPQYLSYPGSRSIPSDIPPGTPFLEDARKFACFQNMRQTIEDWGGMPRFTSLLTTQATMRFWVARKNRRMALKSMWAFGGLMELMARELHKTICWEIRQEL